MGCDDVVYPEGFEELSYFCSLEETIRFLERKFIRDEIFKPYFGGNTESKAEKLFSITNKVGSIDEFIKIRAEDIVETVFKRARRNTKEKIISIIERAREILKCIKNWLGETFENKYDSRHIMLAFIFHKYIEDTLKNNLLTESRGRADMNPHLLTMFRLHKLKDENGLIDEERLLRLLKFVLYQNVTRSIVTSWGYFVEKLLVYSGALPESEFRGWESYKEFLHNPVFSKEEYKKGYNIDMVKISHDGQHWYYQWLQIKSGPNTMNVQMVKSLLKVFKELYGSISQMKETGEFPKGVAFKFLLGMTYGSKDSIDPKITKYFEEEGYGDNLLSGKELWDTIGEYEGYYLDVFKIIDSVSKELLGDEFDIVSEIDSIAESMLSEWKEKLSPLKTEEEFWDMFM